MGTLQVRNVLKETSLISLIYLSLNDLKYVTKTQDGGDFGAVVTTNLLR